MGSCSPQPRHILLHVHYTIKKRKLDENDKDKDNCLLPLCRQDTKKGKRLKEVQAPCGLVIILRHWPPLHHHHHHHHHHHRRRW
jgi:hypothetical protein